ncbi:unnamed protein product [Linum trigynum]|uniref:Uncharacterized protein n=1 Tax=Linum trigynum TaxID=586398 RepID=A0AAV2FHG8_9ROSI
MSPTGSQANGRVERQPAATPSSVDLFLFAILVFFLAKYGCPLLATLPVLFLALWALMKELSSNDKADDVADDGGRADVSVGGKLPPRHDDGSKEMIREALMSWEEEVMVIEAQLLEAQETVKHFHRRLHRPNCMEGTSTAAAAANARAQG